MRRRRVIIILAVCVLVGIGVVALWPGPKEPEYSGKKLSEWLARYKDPPTTVTFAKDGSHMHISKFQPAPGPSSDEAADAIRKIGTNALPFMVAWINYEPPAWKGWSLELSVRLRSLWRRIFRSQKSLTVVIYPQDAKTRADRASYAFYLFGREALPAVKRLSEIESNKSHPDASHRAWIALASIGRSISNSESNEVATNRETTKLDSIRSTNTAKDF